MWLPIFIFCARVADVSLGTLGLICITRGHRALAVGLGFVEVTVWVGAVASVFNHLDQWLNVLAYAGGYATGLGLGMWLESKLALGVQRVTLVSQGHADALAAQLRRAGVTTTILAGVGRDGPVNVCFIVVPRRTAPAVADLAKEVDPEVVVTVEDVRSTSVRRHARWTPLSNMLAPFASRGASVRGVGQGGPVLG